MDAVAFTADGSRLVSAASDGQVKWWDVASGEELRVLRCPPEDLGGRFPVYLGRSQRPLMVSGSWHGAVRVWAFGHPAQLRERRPGARGAWEGCANAGAGGTPGAMAGSGQWCSQ